MEKLKTIENNGVEVKVKRSFLTGGQVGNLVAEAIKIYREGGLLDDYAYNPIDMEMNFYAGLFYFTLDDYELEDNGKFEELFGAGIHNILLEEVTNAKLAYDLMWKTAKEVGNSIGIILSKISSLIGSLPEQEDLNELMNKLPDEWKVVKDEYDNIIGKRLEGDKE